MSKLAEKRRLRAEALENEMRLYSVTTPDGIKKLWSIVGLDGVKAIIYYYNRVERKSNGNIIKVEDVIFDQGLLFNSGLELRRIEKRFVNYFKKAGAEVVMRRERIPNYSL